MRKLSLAFSHRGCRTRSVIAKERPPLRGCHLVSTNADSLGQDAALSKVIKGLE